MCTSKCRAYVNCNLTIYIKLVSTFFRYADYASVQYLVSDNQEINIIHPLILYVSHCTILTVCNFLSKCFTNFTF